MNKFTYFCQATVEITSRYDGVVAKIHYKVGEMAKVGQPLIDIEVEGKDAPAPAKAKAAAARPATSNNPVGVEVTLTSPGKVAASLPPVQAVAPVIVAVPGAVEAQQGDGKVRVFMFGFRAV